MLSTETDTQYANSGTSEQRTHWGDYKFTCLVLYNIGSLLLRGSQRIETTYYREINFRTSSSVPHREVFQKILCPSLSEFHCIVSYYYCISVLYSPLVLLGWCWESLLVQTSVYPSCSRNWGFPYWGLLLTRQLHAAVMTSLAAAVAVKRNRQTILLIFLSPFRLTFDLHQKIPKYIIY